MGNTVALTEAIVEMKEDEALELTRQLLEKDTEPLTVFDAYKKALEEVGNRFEKQLYFIPELILAGNMMATAAEIIKPYLGNATKESSRKIGKILIATVAGDIHDIGKNIVAMMLDINGFDVKDLGVDVPVKKIIEEAMAFKADIIGLSGLLTLAFTPMREVVEGLSDAGIRDKIKVIIGGGQMDEQVRQYVGADAFVIDAVSGINICKGWVK